MNSILHFKNKHKDKECLLLNCGPSLNDYTEKQIREAAKDKIVIAVKQAYLKVPDIVDYHFWNCCNLPLPKNGVHYNYGEEKPIVITSSNFPFGVRWSLQQHIDYFFKIPQLHETPALLVSSNNFEYLSYENKPTTRPIGPGIMYETVVFALELFGFSTVTCVGWDLSNKVITSGFNEDNIYEHFYDNDVHNPGYILDWEVDATCKSSEPLYKWLLSKDTQLMIASNKSHLFEGIPRVKL